jgi:hypothetical protein
LEADLARKAGLPSASAACHQPPSERALSLGEKKFIESPKRRFPTDKRNARIAWRKSERAFNRSVCFEIERNSKIRCADIEPGRQWKACILQVLLEADIVEKPCGGRSLEHATVPIFINCSHNPNYDTVDEDRRAGKTAPFFPITWNGADNVDVEASSPGVNPRESSNYRSLVCARSFWKPRANSLSDNAIDRNLSKGERPTILRVQRITLNFDQCKIVRRRDPADLRRHGRGASFVSR